MKKRIIISVTCGLLAAASVYAKPYAIPTAGIDFRRVDDVMDAIEKQAIALEVQNGDNFASVSQAFDPARSSLEDETLAYTLSGSVKNAPWNNGKGTLTIATDTSLKTDRVSPLKGVRGEVSVKATADILELVRYTGNKIQASNDIYYDRDFGVRQRALVSEMTKVASIADLAQLLNDGKQLAADMVDNEIGHRMDQINCLRNLTCGNVTHDQWGNITQDQSQILWAEVDMRMSLQAKEVIEHNNIQVNGNTLTVTIAPKQYASADDATVLNWKRSSVVFTPSTLTLSSQGFVSVSLARLDSFNRDLERHLSAVSVDDATKHADLLRAYRDELVSFRKIMNGQTTDLPSSAGSEINH